MYVCMYVLGLLLYMYAYGLDDDEELLACGSLVGGLLDVHVCV